MGVLAGKFPSKTGERYGEGLLGKLAGIFKALVASAEVYGVSIAEREVEARLNRPKK